MTSSEPSPEARALVRGWWPYSTIGSIEPADWDMLARRIDAHTAAALITALERWTETVCTLLQTAPPGMRIDVVCNALRAFAGVHG